MLKGPIYDKEVLSSTVGIYNGFHLELVDMKGESRLDLKPCNFQGLSCKKRLLSDLD